MSVEKEGEEKEGMGEEGREKYGSLLKRFRELQREHKKLKKKLYLLQRQNETESLFKLMADAAPVLIWISDLSKGCFFFNKPWLDFTGRTWEQEVGNGWVEGVQSSCIETYSSAFDKREPFTMVYRLRRFDGKYRWILDNGVPRFSPNKEFQGFIGSCIDITEQREAQEAVRISERNYRAIVEDQTELICKFCPRQGNRIEFANESYCHFFATSKEHIIGREFPFANQNQGYCLSATPSSSSSSSYYSSTSELLSPPSFPFSLAATASGTYTSSDILIEKEVFHPSSGSMRWIAWTMRLIHDDVVQAVGKDITERKQAMMELKRAKELAVAALEAKTQFMNNISHELRTPLNGVIGGVSLLRTTSLSVEQQDLVSTIEQSSQKLLGTVNDVLDMNLLEGGKLTLITSSFSVSDLVENSLESFHRLAAERKNELRKRVDSGVPSTVVGDERRVRQVLNNLLSNAVKFTEKGRIDLTVSLAAPKDEEEKEDRVSLLFTIHDTGIGIPRNRVEDIWQPFTQADLSTTRSYGGIGLGLSIAQNVVKRMGGNIWIESFEGQGTTASFVVPVRTVEEPKSGKTADVWNSLGKNLPLNILIVEDDAMNRKIEQKMLSTMGYSADVACDGVEAIKAVKERKYDLILMDVMMPRLDGLSASRRIRELLPGRPPVILAVTASSTSTEQQCLEAGMDGFLTKPMAIATFRWALKTWAKQIHSFDL